MTYWPVRDVSGATLRMMPNGPNSLIIDGQAVDEFTNTLDVIMFGPSGVVVTGLFMPAADHICSFSEKGFCFIQHVESIILGKLQTPGNTYVETVPLIDYLFRYHDCDHRRDSSVTKQFAMVDQNVILPRESLQSYIEDTYWQASTCPVSICRPEPHSTFRRRGFGMHAALTGDLWHIRVVSCARHKKKKRSSSLVSYKD